MDRSSNPVNRMHTVTAAPGQIWWHKWKRYHVKITAANDERVVIHRVEPQQLAGRKFWMPWDPRRPLRRRSTLVNLVDRFRFVELEGAPMPDSIEPGKTTAEPQ